MLSQLEIKQTKSRVMIKLLLTLAFLLLAIVGFSQTTISGKVVDEKNGVVAGANVFLEGTYDGATSDEKGLFRFTTTETGSQIIVVSFLSFETTKMTIEVGAFDNQTIVLKESVNTLDAVSITAGNFESGEKARVSVLKPLDIVTTAGSVGDIVAALQTLPGTQNVGESGRLFVRGGEADETQTYVDGIRVAQPYGATTGNLPTRGRFSPFLFSGISFSTGGYSAEYGDALSSVLLLNTQDEPDQNKTEVSVMTVGLGLGNTQKWSKSSLSVNASYINLAPYQVLVKQNVEWNKPFQSLAGESVYRYHFANGTFKVYAAYDSSNFDINQENVNYTDKVRVDLNNNNFYFNSSYKGKFGSNWSITTGLGYGHSQNKIGIVTDKVDNEENSVHFKLKLKKDISDRIKLSFGGDYFVTDFTENFTPSSSATLSLGYTNAIGALYTEGDIFFSKNLAAKVGLRASQNSLLDENSISPRLSLGYKVAKNSQFSFAYGDFNQMPNAEYIKFSKNHAFESERASHYILNFQYNKDGQTFRAETYYKDYSNLVRYDTRSAQYNSVFSNTGSGYATGLDLFWRDNKSIKNLEYWVSYSYIDSKRVYRNYTANVTPSFIADQSVSLVTKYWINDWKSQIGFTNSFSTGRPYNNPNDVKFMNGKTKAFNSLSFNWAYLLSSQKILYFSVSNMLGTQNVFGYDYATMPDANGIYNRKAITPTADRFFFIGFFWTISNDKKDNQLKNL
jgi:CarboxypepD_reg-like domain/TonB-dependent Receptor Plug Domain